MKSHTKEITMRNLTARRSAAVISSLFLAFVLAGCGSDDESSTAVPAEDSSTTTTGTVEAADQDGDGST